MNPDTNSFFLVTPLGFEELALQELKEKWEHFTLPHPFPHYQVMKGGIELICEQNLGFHLNLILKIPTKILLRLDAFKCRDFPKLFKKISKFKWNDYLMGQMPVVEAVSHKSKLIHTTRIEETVIDGIKKYYKGNPPKEKHLKLIDRIPETKLQVLLDNDALILSINTGGELLYKRGLKTHVNVAPIRENLAAALLLHLKNHLTGSYDTLIDPMCGSGTFLLEDMNDLKVNRKRDFSFLHFPCYKKVELPRIESRGIHYLGCDIDPKTVAITMHNLPNSEVVTLKVQDHFHGEKIALENAILITNPPYGKRIKLDDPQKFFSDLIRKSFELYSPIMAGFIIPKGQSFKLDKNRKIISELEFKNGGTPVIFYIIQ